MRFNPRSRSDRSVLAASMLSELSARGFVEVDCSRRELVFVRPVEGRPGVQLKVWTSIDKVTRVARGVGADAIRVCATRGEVGSRGERGLVKTVRVNRVGTIGSTVERMLSRIDAMDELIRNGQEHASVETREADPRIEKLAACRGRLSSRDQDFADSLIAQFNNKGWLSKKQWPWVTKLAQRAW